MAKAGSTGFKKAMSIQFASKYLNVIIQLLLTAILARLLTPEEYGVVAVVVLFTSFFTLLSDMGLGPAIVQFRELRETDFSALFTFSCIFGACLALVFCAVAHPISVFYGKSELYGLLMLASVAIFFNAVNMVPNGLLLREKKFLAIGVRLIVSTCSAGVVAVAMALCGFGAVSLIVQSIVSSIVVFAWNFFSSGLKIGNRHFVAPVKTVLSYSLFQFGFSTVNFFSRNLDNILIGKVLGTTSLGFYDKAYKLSTYPISFLAGVVGSVLQPYLAKYQDQPDILYLHWLKVAKALSLIAMPIALVCFCCSEEVIILFFGEQWHESVPLFQALSVSMYFQIVNNPAGPIFQSAKKTNYMFFHSLLATGITTMCLIIGLFSENILTVSFCISIAYCLHTGSIAYFLVKKTLGQSIANYFGNFVLEVGIALLVGAAYVLFWPQLGLGLVPSFLIKASVILLVVISAYAISGQLNQIKALIKK